jgi:hypothetical protein
MVFRQTCASLLLGIAICVGLFIGCSHEHSPALIPYPGATDISFRELGGADHVTYHVNTKFPAPEVIGAISDKLKKGGWKASEHDELNPQMPSIQVATWVHGIVGSGQKERCAERWIGDWRNESGDFARYSFTYFYPPPEAEDEFPVCKFNRSILARLEVDGDYMPAPVFRNFMRVVDEFEKKHPNR